MILFIFIVELNPYAAHLYFNRANLYASLRKYKESEDDYTRGRNPHPPLPGRLHLSTRWVCFRVYLVGETLQPIKQESNSRYMNVTLR